MKILFTVPGEPQGKGRPRFSARGGKPVTYTPDKFYHPDSCRREGKEILPMNFYIASRLENADTVRYVAGELLAYGHRLTYDWTLHGSVQREGPERIREVAEAERHGVVAADTVIVILPGGRGTHAELGIALALRKRIVICAAGDALFQQDERTCAFYWSDGVTRAVGTISDWLAAILQPEALAAG